MVDSNTIVLNNKTKVDDALLKSGRMNLSIINGIGIEATVNFKVLEFTKNGSFLDTSFVLSSEPLDVPISLNGYVLDLELDSDSQYVNYVSVIDISSDQEMSLSFGESISIDVLIDSLSFSNVSGYVDPVMVDIDTIEQEINLPDQLENLEFSKIEMNFSFQSNIELPVYLDLNLTSFNDQTGESIIKNIINTANKFILIIKCCKYWFFI